MLNKKIIIINCFIFILSICFFFITLVAANYYSKTPKVQRQVIKPQPLELSPSLRPEPSFYYGINVEMGQLLPESKNYIKNSSGEDLIDLAARLGITLFRITNANNGIKNGDGTYTEKQWNSVLNKMQAKGIKALILIESPTVYQKTITPAYLTLVQKYIIESKVPMHPDVYGVDLYNEPLITPHNIAIMQHAAEIIKKKYPLTKLTVGWWGVDTLQKGQDGQEIYRWDDYAAGKQLDSFIDFYSLHMYGFDKASSGIYPEPYFHTKNFINNVKKDLQPTKPILIEEFGATNGEAISDEGTLGSPPLQANIYNEIYQAFQDMKDPSIIGAVSYQFHPRTSSPDAWTITKNQGNYLFPAAYVLQKYATGKTDIPLSLPISPVPQDVLLSNTDNDTTVTLHTNDIVGLKITLDHSDTYITSFSNPALFTTSEYLTNPAGDNNYYGVFHASTIGNGDISFNNSHGTKVFKINVIVK